MQKWEYKIIRPERGWPGGIGARETSRWNITIGDDMLAELGNNGWELVNVVPQSDYIGEVSAGVTTSELWIFKRPVPGP